MKSENFRNALKSFNEMVERGEATSMSVLDKRITDGKLVVTRAISGNRLVFYVNDIWAGEFTESSQFPLWGELLEHKRFKVFDIERIFIVCPMLGEGSGMWANGSFVTNRHAHCVSDWL